MALLLSLPGYEQTGRPFPVHSLTRAARARARTANDPTMNIDDRVPATVIRELIEADNRFTPVEPFVPGEEEQTDFERYYVTHKEIGRCSFRKAP